MSGLCGWLGAEWGGRDPEEAMAAMASGLAVEAGTTAWSDTAPERGLYAAGPPSACHVHADGAVLAAIVGQPRWLDSDLVDLAAREGHAKSLALAYEQHGRRLFTALRGSWALAVIDAGRGRLLAAVDRLAVHRLCYATPPRGVVLGTTVDAVAVHPSIDTSIDPQAIFDYLFFEYIPAPATIYGEIRKLFRVSACGMKTGRQGLTSTGACPTSTGRHAAAAAISTPWPPTCARRSTGPWIGRSTVPIPSQVGTFLSGGVDSSTLTGLLAKRAPGQVHAYSIGFDAAGYDELEFARTAARHFKVDLHEYYVTPEDVISFVPTMARIYDEPYGNSSAVPAYYCAKMAQERGTRMLLAGDGGDELFAGNERYVRQRFFDAYDVLPHALRASFIEPVIERWPGGAALYPVRKARSYIKQANTPLPDRLHYYNYFGTITAAQCFAPGVGADIDARHPLTTMREHYRDNPSRSPLQRMMNLDLRMTIADGRPAQGRGHGAVRRHRRTLPAARRRCRRAGGACAAQATGQVVQAASLLQVRDARLPAQVNSDQEQARIWAAVRPLAQEQPPLAGADLRLHRRVGTPRSVPRGISRVRGRGPQGRPPVLSRRARLGLDDARNVASEPRIGCLCPRRGGARYRSSVGRMSATMLREDPRDLIERPRESAPLLLAIIDTEEEFDWSRPL